MSASMDRFFSKIDVLPGNDCLLWTGKPNQGYGRISFHGKLWMAHRWIYEKATGETLTPEMCIDHMCRVRNCVNPAHLQLLTKGGNAIVNSISPTALNKEKTHCIHGHEFTPENLLPSSVRKGVRKCRACFNKLRMKRYYANPAKHNAERVERRRITGR